MAASPLFVGTPKQAQTQIGTANTARDGTGTLGTLFTAGASGSRLDRIKFTAVGTVTAGVLRIFISYDGGTTKRLYDEVLVTATTPSTTVAAFTSTYSFPSGWNLQANAIVYVATNNAESFNAFAEGGDF
jgi:hypothetical protein